MGLAFQASCMGDHSARRWLVAEVNAMHPLGAGHALPCVCALAEILVARNGVAHDQQRCCHILLGTLQEHGHVVTV